MKKQNFSLLAMLGFSICLSACNVVTGMHETANERYMKDQNQIKAEKAREAAAFAAGQPGKITVNGTVVQNGRIDSRIQIKQTAGKSERLKKKEVSLATKNNDDAETLRSASKNVSDSLTQPSTDKNYVLVGCSKGIDASWTAELSEAKPEASNDNYSIVANTVVLCGDKALPFSKVSITTHHLYMKNASLVMKAAGGSIVIATDKLHLVGKNQIQTLGMDAVSNVAAAPSLELNIVQGLFGDGILSLESQGGTCKNP